MPNRSKAWKVWEGQWHSEVEGRSLEDGNKKARFVKKISSGRQSNRAKGGVAKVYIRRASG